MKTAKYASFLLVNYH